MSVPAFDPNSPTFLGDSRAAARIELRRLLASPTLTVFAFATSSLRGVPIQVAALGVDGVPWAQTIRTGEPLDPESQAYHGLQQADVDAGTPLAGLLTHLRHVLDGQNAVVTFSPDFMRDALVRACRLEGLECFGTSHWLSAQELLAPLCGAYNWTTGRWSRPKLTDCIGDLALSGDLAPIGTALGNVQRLHAVMVHQAQEAQP